ncbi:MarR family transcriptional regulator [Vallitalea longa]|uniref:MarR family transcriptional regulator n=1 Tax=Vallitalea longa TaxID=2936439 RepID=A0A9W5YAJ6_9FIRM|nr:MarR family transcriptional regulator [Vallitalea longa]GKX27748.1 MarR family transcriptional regulator [Vallitalea longa]
MDYKKYAEKLVEYQFKLSRVPKHINNINTDQIRGEKSVIGYLIEVEDGVTPSKLAQFIGVSTARVANILNKLEDKGCIIRKMDTKDRRRIIVYITEKGRKTGLRAKEYAVEHISKVLAELGEHDAKEHIRIMKRIYHITLEHEQVSEND